MHISVRSLNFQLHYGVLFVKWILSNCLYHKYKLFRNITYRNKKHIILQLYIIHSMLSHWRRYINITAIYKLCDMLSKTICLIKNISGVFFAKFMPATDICPWNSCYSLFYLKQGNISSWFSRNSEADASELLENWKEMFPRYYMHSDVFLSRGITH